MSENRYQIKIKGIVQGIGFRPFIYKLATELNLKGWVNNSGEGVLIEIECDGQKLEHFTSKIKQEKPQQSQIYSLEIKELNWVGYQEFKIKNSESINNLNKSAIVLPDLNTCCQCLQEIFDPKNRRYRYAFTNCTNCGPRYSIIKDLPYDRLSTSMSKFKMCWECEKEYHDPLDRRFHAQPNCCKICGPHLELWDRQGNCLAKFEPALKQTAELIRLGKIIAVKGLGGFHLIVDSGNKSAVNKLRQRKNRPDKPLALIYPNLEQIKENCFVSPLEEKLLYSSASPIVLLKRINNNYYICEQVAPKNPYLGVMLPSTPLHHLLLRELNFPVVATSANLNNEPICIDEFEALTRLNSIADYFLVHNRPILRAVDDSVVRVIKDELMILRRARGYAPLPLSVSHFNEQNSAKILAVGGHLKNTIAIAFNQQIFLSQHIGNLETPETVNSFEKTINSLSNIYDFEPNLIVCDAHPDYYSTQYARQLSINKNQQIPVIQVQHHLAHIFATMTEHKLNPPFLGIAWDGTGSGLDRTIWGGEFFYITNNKIARIASFSPFPLLGGNKAISEPRRIALVLLDQAFGNLENLPSNLDIINCFSSQELKVFKTLIKNKLNSPLTSSVGRLFDGVASLLGIVQKISFEGQAAMQLEFAINDLQTNESYPFQWQYTANSCSYIDWKPLIKNIIQDYLSQQPLSLIAAKFHLTLREIIKTIAHKIGVKNVVLSGGCFQNKYLLENTINCLRQEKFTPYWSQKIPINDGGLAVGQIAFCLREVKNT
jgi:hydrogenase maturation protein HypF